jgi:hypothetical protein
MTLAVRGKRWQKAARCFPNPSFSDVNRALILRFKGGRLGRGRDFPNGVKSYPARPSVMGFPLIPAIRRAAAWVGKDPIVHRRLWR